MSDPSVWLTEPVTVLPGAGHFFHGRLTQVKSLILRNLGHAEAG